MSSKKKNGVCIFSSPRPSFRTSHGIGSHEAVFSEPQPHHLVEPLMKHSTLSVLLLVGTSCTALADAKTAITCGHVFDAPSGTLRNATTLIIDGERISEVRDGIATTGADKVVDLSGLTCLPGFIDSHTHLMMEMGPKSSLERTRLNGSDYAFRSTQYARRTLMAGFTTVRNLGDHGGQDSIALRNAIDRKSTRLNSSH